MAITCKRHLKFVDRFLSHGNQTLAYIEAGFAVKGARQNASRLMTNDDIKELIALEQERLAAELCFTREEALRILISQATASFADFVPLINSNSTLDQNAYENLGVKRFALKSVENGRHGIKIRLYDSLAAIESLWVKLGFDRNSSKNDWWAGFEHVENLIKKDKK